MIEPFQTHSRWNATSLSGPHLQNVSYLYLHIFAGPLAHVDSIDEPMMTKGSLLKDSRP